MPVIASSRANCWNNFPGDGPEGLGLLLNQRDDDRYTIKSTWGKTRYNVGVMVWIGLRIFLERLPVPVK